MAGDTAGSEMSGPGQVAQVTLTFDHQLTDAEIEQLKMKTEAQEVQARALKEELVGGGIWRYGTDPVNHLNVSYYWHGEQPHRASVSNRKYGVVRSECVRPNKWASAVQPYDYENHGNKAFWSVDFCR